MLLRIFMETMQNIVGPNGLKAILNYARLKKYIDRMPPDNGKLEIPVEDLQKIIFALVKLFGHKGASALKIKAGRNIIRLAIKKRPKIARAIQLAARFLPESKRMKVALERFIKETEARLPLPSKEHYYELREEKEYFVIIDKAYWESEGAVSETPSCFAFVGMMEELMEWITGHPHKVEEIECKATGHKGDAFKIMKVRQVEREV